jgi:hypothetical protein
VRLINALPLPAGFVPQKSTVARGGRAGPTIVRGLQRLHRRTQAVKLPIAGPAEIDRARTRVLRSHTPGGLRIAVCPATYLDVSCVECQVCSRPRPNGTVMGFPAHASGSKYVDAVFTAMKA